MNCEIKPLKDRKRAIDTLPPRGKVNEVRKEWLVHEDGALAYRLQNEEFKQHLIGNKSRNIQIREDFPCAKEEQTKETIEAARAYHLWLQQQEEEDARVANEIARKIEIEESERRYRLEERDVALAKQLQDKEKVRIEKKKYDRRDLEVHTPKKNEYSSKRGNLAASRVLYDDDVAGSCVVDSQPRSRNGFYDGRHDTINNVGLSVQDDFIDTLSSCHLNDVSRSDNARFSPSPILLSEDEARKIQEEQDAEFARRLQETEDPLDPLTRDHLLAIETQDKELARLLQEKEKARLRRAREKAKAKAAARRALEQEEATASGNVPLDDATESVLTHKPKPRYPDPDEILSAPLEVDRQSVDNIAMVIDPTYPRGASRMPSADSELESPVDTIAPPYMPIQGQRRFPDKKSKTKEGCKQQ